MSVQPPQRPQLLAAKRLDAGRAALGAAYVKLAGPEVDVIPAALALAEIGGFFAYSKKSPGGLSGAQ